MRRQQTAPREPHAVASRLHATPSHAAPQVEKFVRESGKFQETCNTTFAQLDWQGTGRVATK